MGTKKKVISYLSVNKYYFYCPGCEMGHFLIIQNGEWNGNLYRPTINRSLNINHGDCRVIIKDGKIEYSPDSKHKLAGKTIEMEEA
jgi:hypothetical protein